MKTTIRLLSFFMLASILQPLIATANPADKFKGIMQSRCSDETFKDHFNITEQKNCKAGMKVVAFNCNDAFLALINDRNAENQETLKECIAANATYEFGNGKEDLIKGRGPSSGFVSFNEYKADMIEPACSGYMLKKCSTVADEKCPAIVESVADSCAEEYIVSITKPNPGNEQKHASCMINGFAKATKTDVNKLEACLEGSSRAAAELAKKFMENVD